MHTYAPRMRVRFEYVLRRSQNKIQYNNSAASTGPMQTSILTRQCCAGTVTKGSSTARSMQIYFTDGALLVGLHLYAVSSAAAKVYIDSIY